MPLPKNGSPWPLPQHKLALAHMSEWSAWYSGDPDQLRDHYATANGQRPRTREAQYQSGMVGRMARWWWGVPASEGEPQAKLHVPLAADICGTSADLLFSERIGLTSEGNAKLTETLEGLMDDGLETKLHEAAEVTAALGGGYLRVVWDAAVSDMPWTDVVHADMAAPEFRWGRLSAVTFWVKLAAHEDAKSVWRLLERHEPGRILHGLYRGSDNDLGMQVALDDHPDAAHIATMVDKDGAVVTGTQLLTATYVPNMLPNRMHRGSHQGRSDLQGVTPFLDALDEAYSSWWRDIRHGKSRIHVPASYLDSAGPGQAGIADMDREVYVPLQGVLATAKDGLAMDAHQFTIRVAEHADTCKMWTERIIESAGYSTQSLSSGTGGAVTAAEVHSHERRSYMTRGKKARYWSAAIRDHLQALVEVANAQLRAGVTPGDIKVEFPDGVQESANALANTVLLLRNAEAASTEVRVKMMHPDWDDTQVQAEVALILGEIGGAPVAVPDDAGF